MSDEKNRIKKYFGEILKPSDLGLKDKLVVTNVRKLGQGTSNLNYLVIANGRKFIFRLNMDPKNKKKSRKEYDSLRLIERYDFGPKAWFIDESRKHFDSDFIIISYLDGKTIDKLSEYLKPQMIRKIALLCAKLHSVKLNNKLKNLDKVDTLKGYRTYYVNLKKSYLTYIRKELKDKRLLKIINGTYDKIGEQIPNSPYKSDQVLSQGDFCEQNVISFKGKYNLIDFEDLEITDRRSHLAHLLVDFGRPFEGKDKELFIRTYCDEAKIDIPDLIEGINIWIPLKIFAVFLWSVQHTLKVKNKEMHSSFLKNNDLDRDVLYVRTMFKRNLRFKNIDQKYKKFDVGIAF
jgi:aminoglycoside phosphotransferase (APT) family kinase protein